MNPSEKALYELQADIQKLEKTEIELRDIQSKIKAKLEDYNSIMEDKICPTCDSPIETEDFSQRLSHKQNELDYCRVKVTESSKSLESLKQILELKRSFDQDHQILNDQLRTRHENSEDLRNYKHKHAEAAKFVRENEAKLESVRTSVSRLQRIESEFSELRCDLRECESDIQELNGAIGKDRAHVSDWERELKETEQTLKKKQLQKEKAEKLDEHSNWIQEYFVPTVDAIEKQVLLNINLEFDAQFKKSGISEANSRIKKKFRSRPADSEGSTPNSG